MACGVGRFSAGVETICVEAAHLSKLHI